MDGVKLRGGGCTAVGSIEEMSQRVSQPAVFMAHFTLKACSSPPLLLLLGKNSICGPEIWHPFSFPLPQFLTWLCIEKGRFLNAFAEYRVSWRKHLLDRVGSNDARPPCHHVVCGGTDHVSQLTRNTHIWMGVEERVSLLLHAHDQFGF